MGQLSAKLRGGRDFVTYWCQGCEGSHSVPFAPASPGWQWNGDVNLPTFSPSVLIRTGHHVPGTQLRPDGKCSWCEDAKKDGHKTLCSVCHTIVTDGQVQFLADCTHRFAGQLVPVPDLPEHMRDAPMPSDSSST